MTTWMLTLFLLADAPAIAEIPEPPAPLLRLPGRIVHVHDGDTVTVRVEVRMRVRLIGCWAPEIRGAEKEAGLKSLINLQGKAWPGEACVVEIPLHDDIGDATSLGRILGKVSVDGVDLSDYQVSSGHAKRSR